MITPAISILGAVEGLSVATPLFTNWVVPISVAILIGLFVIQQHGTHRVGRLFGPVMVVWFVTIALRRRGVDPPCAGSARGVRSQTRRDVLS